MARRLGLLAVVSLLLLGTVPVAAQTSQERRQLDEIDQRIADLNDRIAAAQGTRSGLAEQLAATEARMAELRALVREAEAKVAAVEAEILGVEEELDRLRLELAAQKQRLAHTREEVERTRELVRKRAVEMYVEGSQALSGMLLGLDQVADVAVGLEYAAQVVAASEQLMRSLEVLKRQEERQKELMEQQEAGLESVVATLEQRRADLESHRAELEEARQAEAAERDKQLSLLAQVEHEIEHFEGEIDALEKEQAAIEAAIRARLSTGTERSDSGFMWPLNGPVVSPYGYRIHPITGVRKLHTGLDIDGPYGAPIVASASGTVILAAWYGGYGNAVVIDHGGGLATLYAHQSSMAVGVGTSVQIGQVIGYVGSTGFSTGPHLHFEVRENGSPVNPLGYLP